MKRKQAIEKAQKKSKELGHCICNLKLKCPCERYIKNRVCNCSEYFVTK